MFKKKVFVGVIVVIAVVMAILSVTLPLQMMNGLMLVTRFFEVMIPVLAVGALLKYLCCCPHHHGECAHEDKK